MGLPWVCHRPARVLRATAKAVGVAVDGVHQHVALLMKRAEKSDHPLEGGFDEAGGLILRIRASRDLDVEPEGGQTFLGGTLSGDKPALRICGFDQYRRDLGVFGLLSTSSLEGLYRVCPAISDFGG